MKPPPARKPAACVSNAPAFSDVPVRQHFVIQDLVPGGIVVLTAQHQVRDIEALIAESTPAFLAEIERLKRLPPLSSSSLRG